MAKFFIEVPHGDEIVACARTVQVFLNTGSHFLTHADWGCKDSVHKAWFIAEAETKEDARRIVPPALRASATVIQLNAFTLPEIEELLRRHAT